LFGVLVVYFNWKLETNKNVVSACCNKSTCVFHPYMDGSKPLKGDCIEKKDKDLASQPASEPKISFDFSTCAIHGCFLVTHEQQVSNVKQNTRMCFLFPPGISVHPSCICPIRSNAEDSRFQLGFLQLEYATRILVRLASWIRNCLILY